MSNGPTFDQRQAIFAHKSRIERAERERDEALALVKERTEERDRARRIAVELEQQLAAVESELQTQRDRYQEMWNRNPTEATGWASDAVDECVDAVELITDQVSIDLIADAAKDGAA